MPEHIDAGEYHGPDRRQPAPQPHSGGLTGIWATFANLSAVTILCGLTVSMYRDMSREAAEARMMFRDEMKIQREADRQQSLSFQTELRAMASEIRAAVSEMRQARTSIQATERAVTGNPP